MSNARRDMLGEPKLFSEESELRTRSPNPAANAVQVFVDRQQESCVCVIAVGQFNAKEELGVAAISGKREVAGADLKPRVLAVEQQDDLGMKHYVRDFQQIEGSRRPGWRSPASTMATTGVSWSARRASLINVAVGAVESPQERSGQPAEGESNLHLVEEIRGQLLPTACKQSFEQGFGSIDTVAMRCYQPLGKRMRGAVACRNEESVPQSSLLGRPLATYERRQTRPLAES